MSTFKNQSKNRVPVGMTPVPKYATWDEHRDALHREAAGRRATARRRIEMTVEHDAPR